MSSQESTPLNHGYKFTDPAIFESQYEEFGTYASVGEFIPSLDAYAGPIKCVKHPDGFTLTHSSSFNSNYTKVSIDLCVDEMRLRAAISMFNSYASWCKKRRLAEAIEMRRQRIAEYEKEKASISKSEMSESEEELPDPHNKDME